MSSHNLWARRVQTLTFTVCQLASAAPIGTAQKRRVSVPIDSQLIGKAQIKRVWLRHGSHTTYGNEVVLIRSSQGHPLRRKLRLFVMEYIFPPILPLVQML